MFNYRKEGAALPPMVKTVGFRAAVLYDHFSSNSSNENIPGMFQLNTPGDNCLYFNSHGDHINGRVFHSYHGVGNYCPDERYYTEGIKMH